MRYDTLVNFVKQTAPIRLPNGDYSDEEATLTPVWANVSDLGEERVALIFGDVKQKAKVVRLQNQYIESFDFIEIDGIRYKDTRPKHFRHESVFYVGEVQ